MSTLGVIYSSICYDIEGEIETYCVNTHCLHANLENQTHAA